MIDKRPNYLHCPKYKAQTQKHVAVCKEGRWRKNCKPYQKFRQPELPFNYRKAS